MYVPLLQSYSLRLEPLSLQSLFLDTSEFIPSAKKFKNVDELAAVLLQRRLENTVAGNRWLIAAARQTFRSFVRAYATHSGDTKGIFSVQKLHLGHVSKSFALSESPNVLRSHDDVLGKIVNGTYAVHSGEGEDNEGQKKMTRADRDSKYSLSQKKRSMSLSSDSNNNNSSMKKRRTTGTGDEDSRSAGASASASASPQDGSVKDKRMLQKLKQVGDKKKSSAAPTASGKFRKAGGTGYFRKKLREQSTSEFSS